jgi:hypothetical protein
MDYKLILTGIKNYLFKKPEIERVALEKLKVCKSCPVKSKRLGVNICSDCGCVLNFKTRSNSQCPANQWYPDYIYEMQNYRDAERIYLHLRLDMACSIIESCEVCTKLLGMNGLNTCFGFYDEKVEEMREFLKFLKYNNREWFNKIRELNEEQCAPILSVYSGRSEENRELEGQQQNVAQMDYY